MQLQLLQEMSYTSVFHSWSPDFNCGWNCRKKVITDYTTLFGTALCNSRLNKTGILHCTALYGITLPSTALHCTVQIYTALYGTTLHSTALYCTLRYYNVLYCTALHRTGLHFYVLTLNALEKSWDPIHQLPE